MPAKSEYLDTRGEVAKLSKIGTIITTDDVIDERHENDAQSEHLDEHGNASNLADVLPYLDGEQSQSFLRAEASAPDDESPAVFIERILDRLDVARDTWNNFVNISNRSKIEMLGKIYAAAADTDSDCDRRAALEERMGSLNVTKGRNDFDPQRRSTKDLLLICVLGLEPKTKATKSQWLAALNAAADANVPAEVAAFTRWIDSRGGLVKAAKCAAANDDDPDPDPNRPPPFNWNLFAATLPDTADPSAILPLPATQVAGPFGLGVALFRRLPDGRAELLYEATDIDVVEPVAKAFDDGKSAQAEFERRHVWTLNRIASKQSSNPRFTGQLSLRDFEDFKRATKALAAKPVSREKFFSGEPTVRMGNDPVRKQSKSKAETGGVIPVLSVQQPECAEFDPARFIDGAKPLALVPYDLESGAGESDIPDRDAYFAEQRAIEETLRAKRKAAKERPISTAGSIIDLIEDEDQTGLPCHR